MVIGSFDPHLLIVSAGQDTGTIDPLGRNVVTKAGFRDLGAGARALAADSRGGRLALVQEGGYQVSHLAYATFGMIEGVLDVDTGIEDPNAWLDGNRAAAVEAVDEVAARHATHWPTV